MEELNSKDPLVPTYPEVRVDRLRKESLTKGLPIVELVVSGCTFRRFKVDGKYYLQKILVQRFIDQSYTTNEGKELPFYKVMEHEYNVRQVIHNHVYIHMMWGTNDVNDLNVLDHQGKPVYFLDINQEDEGERMGVIYSKDHG